MTTAIYTSDYTYIDKRFGDWLEKANLTHGDRYDYSFVKFKNVSEKVSIKCQDHGLFKQRASAHIQGQNCPKCSNIIKSEKTISNIIEFVKKAEIVHNSIYKYTDTKYIGAMKKLKIECSSHGDFWQTPNGHLSGKGCPICANHSGYSKIAIQWLESINPNIQHAENGREFIINRENGSFFKVDGYELETNTVYEFHGDQFHGNPDKFASTAKCHPFDRNITAKELYDNTIERENEIKSLGYNLIVVWENDYNK